MNDKALAHNIKTFRELKNIAAKEMAAHLGNSYTAYSQYETGETEPKISTVKKIAEKLEINYLVLLNESPQKIFNFYNSKYSGDIQNQYNFPEKLVEKMIAALEKIAGT